MICVDGQAKKRRFLVKVDGRDVFLRGMPFTYLVMLAWARMHPGIINYLDGWIHKTDIAPGDNQARYIYRLRKELGQKDLIENDRAGYYRLTDEVSFNEETLREHPDNAVSSLFSEVA